VPNCNTFQISKYSPTDRNGLQRPTDTIHSDASTHWAALSANDRREQIPREAMECFADLRFRGTTTRLRPEDGRAFLGMVFDHLNMRHFFREKTAYSQSLDEVAETFAAKSVLVPSFLALSRPSYSRPESFPDTSAQTTHSSKPSVISTSLEQPTVIGDTEVTN